jgi:hypothetical protein
MSSPQGAAATTTECELRLLPDPAFHARGRWPQTPPCAAADRSYRTAAPDSEWLIAAS